MPDNEVGPQRAEALGGAIMVDARRGRVDENLVQELVLVSQSVGWERSAGEELFDAAHNLLRRRRSTLAAELLALSLVMELPFPMDDEDGIPQEITVRLFQLIALAGETRQPAFVRKLRQELRRHLSSDASDSLIAAIIEATREQRAEARRDR